MKISDIFKGASREQSKDFGMVLTLACLIAAYFTEERWALQAAIAVLVINLIWPSIYKVFAYLWFSLAMALGHIMSKVILTLVFVLVVLPIAVIRRLLGIDTLQLKKWKRDNSSVFKTRDHTFGPEDLERPY